MGKYRGNYVRLQYTQTNHYTKEKTEVDYRVELATTPCNFGGVRYWFICPLVVNGRACQRRVAKLYLPPGGRYFGCRHCYNLTYESCKEHDKRVDALRKLPSQVLLKLIETSNVKQRLLVLKACMKSLGRYGRDSLGTKGHQVGIGRTFQG